MKALKGIFQYVWPQWPRLVVVVVSALVVASLLSLSLLTIIPLLKVMVDKEEGGLHGWLDGLTCRRRYGLTADPSAAPGADAVQGPLGLVVLRVQPGSLAQEAGLVPFDRITAIGRTDLVQGSAAQILEVLASTREPELTLQIRRAYAGDASDTTLVLHTPSDQDFVRGLGWSRFGRWMWNLERTALDRARQIDRHVPRQE